jgi:hypothetical protein
VERIRLLVYCITLRVYFDNRPRAKASEIYINCRCWRGRNWGDGIYILLYVISWTNTHTRNVAWMQCHWQSSLSFKCAIFTSQRKFQKVFFFGQMSGWTQMNSLSLVVDLIATSPALKTNYAETSKSSHPQSKIKRGGFSGLHTINERILCVCACNLCFIVMRVTNKHKSGDYVGLLCAMSLLHGYLRLSVQYSLSLTRPLLELPSQGQWKCWNLCAASCCCCQKSLPVGPYGVHWCAFESSGIPRRKRRHLKHKKLTVYRPWSCP